MNHEHQLKWEIPANMLYSVRILILLLVTCRLSLATSLEFRDLNFAVEIPSGWQVLKPPPDQVVVAAQTTDQLKTFLVIVSTSSANELPAALRDMIAGAKQGTVDKGWQITNESEASVDKVPFHVIAARVSAAASTVTYIGGAGTRAYCLQAICKNCDASTDPKVSAILNSFRLLSPTAQVEPERPLTLAYRLGRATTLIAFVAIIGAVIWRSIRSRRRTGKNSQAP